MNWYDTHTHLNDEMYLADWRQVADNAVREGIKFFNLIGYDLPSSATAVNLAKELEQYAVVGIHPHDAANCSEATWQKLGNWLENKSDNRIVAVGEIGLDYYYDNSPRDSQKEAFVRQIELAHTYKLPIVIHNRDAHEDTYNILQEASKNGLLAPIPGVIHCYSGSVEMAKKFLDLGFYLGLDGPLTFKNAKLPLEVAKWIPRERLVLETDCPYLTPVPHRGHRNEPAYLPLIAMKVAEIWGCSLEEVANVTFANAVTLFNIKDCTD